MGSYIRPADAFLEVSVAAAYGFRPPYPEELIVRLVVLAGSAEAAVLDLGCGTGDIARPLAAHVGHVTAVDPSAAMLAAARDAAGGTAPNIEWVQSSAEQFGFNDHYSLLVTAESIHWLDLDLVFEGARRCLGAEGVFAIVGREYESAWDADLRSIIPAYSATKDFVPFDMASLEGPGRLAVEGRHKTAAIARRQKLDAYIEFQHSSAGFARHRMGPESAAEFDRQLRRILEPHAQGEWIEYQTAASLIWGRVA